MGPTVLTSPQAKEGGPARHQVTNDLPLLAVRQRERLAYQSLVDTVLDAYQIPAAPTRVHYLIIGNYMHNLSTPPRTVLAQGNAGRIDACNCYKIRISKIKIGMLCIVPSGNYYCRSSSPLNPEDSTVIIKKNDNETSESNPAPGPGEEVSTRRPVRTQRAARREDSTCRSSPVAAVIAEDPVASTSNMSGRAFARISRESLAPPSTPGRRPRMPPPPVSHTSAEGYTRQWRLEAITPAGRNHDWPGAAHRHL